MNKKIKVLVVDDSAVVRQSMREILESEDSIEVIGTAADPYQAVEIIEKIVPDVITLDIEMPKMDGLTFLKKIMEQHPIPVIICSTLTADSSKEALKAMEYGAVDIITKPKIGTKLFFEESKIQIIDSVKSAYQVDLKKVKKNHELHVPPKMSADVILAKAKGSMPIDTTEKVIVIGASTGGTEAIRIVLEALPMDIPGIVIVQHMPENFTRSFAQRLNDLCQINVKEAENGDRVLTGHALIAPGNKHVLLKRSGAKYYVEVKEGPLVNRHRPSVDVLFRSTARYAGQNALGVILTGMGDDGAKGMLEMKEAGAFNIAQDEKSCIVFGMPKEAIRQGGVDKIISLEKIADELVKLR
ncbi:MAG TPA: chemotaxis response regulator protein-glutamate methylesterase [Spirochaetia bacterium]|nr:chemotaxis response regulator protein-glutamate methylesterase [Spirochaetia bacterium]